MLLAKGMPVSANANILATNNNIYQRNEFKSINQVQQQQQLQQQQQPNMLQRQQLPNQHRLQPLTHENQQNTLPPQFMSAMRTLFELLDTGGSGYILFSEFADKWVEASKTSSRGTGGGLNKSHADLLPSNFLSCLEQVTPANRMISFDKFCAALDLALNNKQRNIQQHQIMQQQNLQGQQPQQQQQQQQDQNQNRPIQHQQQQQPLPPHNFQPIKTGQSASGQLVSGHYKRSNLATSNRYRRGQSVAFSSDSDSIQQDKSLDRSATIFDTVTGVNQNNSIEKLHPPNSLYHQFNAAKIWSGTASVRLRHNLGQGYSDNRASSPDYDRMPPAFEGRRAKSYRQRPSQSIENNCSAAGGYNFQNGIIPNFDNSSNNASRQPIPPTKSLSTSARINEWKSRYINLAQNDTMPSDASRLHEQSAAQKQSSMKNGMFSELNRLGITNANFVGRYQNHSSEREASPQSIQSQATNSTGRFPIKPSVMDNGVPRTTPLPDLGYGKLPVNRSRPASVINEDKTNWKQSEAIYAQLGHTQRRPKSTGPVQQNQYPQQFVPSQNGTLTNEQMKLSTLTRITIDTTGSHGAGKTLDNRNISVSPSARPVRANAQKHIQGDWKSNNMAHMKHNARSATTAANALSNVINKNNTLHNNSALNTNTNNINTSNNLNESERGSSSPGMTSSGISSIQASPPAVGQQFVPPPPPAVNGVLGQYSFTTISGHQPERRAMTPSALKAGGSVAARRSKSVHTRTPVHEDTSTDALLATSQDTGYIQTRSRPASRNSNYQHVEGVDVKMKDEWKSTSARKYFTDGRRHTMPDVTEQQALKHKSLVEEERGLLDRGLEMSALLNDWYGERQRTLNMKEKLFTGSTLSMEYAVQEERLNYLRVHIAEINRRISALLETSEKNFPTPLSLDWNRASTPKPTEDQIQWLSQQNDIINSELSNGKRGKNMTNSSKESTRTPGAMKPGYLRVPDGKPMLTLM